MIVHVTQEHIDKGNVHSPTECPIARALSAATGTPWAVGWADYFELKQHEIQYLPDNAREFMTDLFCGNKRGPFTFNGV